MKLFTCIALLSLAAAPIAAQTRPHLHPDQRIRITTLVGDITSTKAATVLEDSGDTLTLQIEGVQQRVPATSIQVLETSLGRGPRGGWLWKGGLIGTGAGLLLAKYIQHSDKQNVVVGTKPCPGDGGGAGNGRCPDYGYVTRPFQDYAPLVGIGTGLGAVTGFLFPGDRWQKVPLRASVAVAPSARGIVVGISR
ncbi:MAG TPA: hypothetical protein VFH27_10220 [Longimicrobiaceae bacterium]|nr:hypothetical protein [Longimicrobiaceae bacterium]